MNERSSDRDGYRIETGIPYPGEPARASGRKSRYPFSELNVGDSFHVHSHHERFSEEKQLTTAFHKARRLLGYNLKWSREAGGFRIHREAGSAEVKRRRRPERRITGRQNE